MFICATNRVLLPIIIHFISMQVHMFTTVGLFLKYLNKPLIVETHE